MSYIRGPCRMKRPGCKVALIIGICVFLALVVGVWWYVYPIINDPFNDARFDHKEWLSASGSRKMDNPRGPMVEDLQQRFLHKGMTRRQVELIIGKPDCTSKYDLERGIEGYFLGCWGFCAIDPQYLQVQYDKQGMLIRTKIIES